MSRSRWIRPFWPLFWVALADPHGSGVLARTEGIGHHAARLSHEALRTPPASIATMSRRVGSCSDVWGPGRYWYLRWSPVRPPSRYGPFHAERTPAQGSDRPPARTGTRRGAERVR